MKVDILKPLMWYYDMENEMKKKKEGCLSMKGFQLGVSPVVELDMNTEHVRLLGPLISQWTM